MLHTRGKVYLNQQKIKIILRKEALFNAKKN